MTFCRYAVVAASSPSGKPAHRCPGNAACRKAANPVEQCASTLPHYRGRPQVDRCSGSPDGALAHRSTASKVKRQPPKPPSQPTADLPDRHSGPSARHFSSVPPYCHTTPTAHPRAVVPPCLSTSTPLSPATTGAARRCRPITHLWSRGMAGRRRDGPPVNTDDGPSAQQSPGTAA